MNPQENTTETLTEVGTPSVPADQGVSALGGVEGQPGEAGHHAEPEPEPETGTNPVSVANPMSVEQYAWGTVRADY